MYEAELAEPRPYAASGTRVAVKVLHPSLSMDERSVARLHAELAIGGRLCSPHVVELYESGRAPLDGATLHFLVLELVDGRSLARLIADHGRLAEPLVRDVGRQVASGLAAIHDLGVIHRDLKPGNVILTHDHRVKIADLGLARLIEGVASRTATDRFAGSPDYAAPEQFENAALSPATDLYALGVLLLEALTGTNPFRADSPAATMRLHLERTPPRASEARPGTSLALDELIAALLAKSPADRPDSARTCADALERGEQSAWWAGASVRVAEAELRSALGRLGARRETVHVGRADELAALRDAVRRLKQGAGACILIEAEAGLGKTRLLDEVLRGGDASQGLRVLHGASRPGERTAAWGAVGDALLGRFGGPRLVENLAARLGTHADLASRLAAALAGEPARARLGTDALGALACDAVLSLAAERPLLLVLEDMHFATPLAVGLARSVARLAARHPVLVVATTRPGSTAVAELGALPQLTHLSLRPLRDDEVGALVSDALGGSLVAPQVARHVARHCAGSPLLALEILEMLKARGTLQEREGGWWALEGALEDDRLPDLMRTTLLARLGSIASADRAILEAAAVQGLEIDASLLAASLGRAELDVLQALSAVSARTDLVRAAGSRFAFSHHLVQETLQAALPPDARAELHRDAARALARVRGLDLDGPWSGSGADAFALLRHALRGGMGDVARRLSRAALEHAAGGPEISDIPWLVDELLDLLGDDAEPAYRASHLRAKAQALKLIGIADERLVAAGEAALAAHPPHGDPAQRRHLELTLAGYLGIVGRTEHAREVAVRVLNEARREGDLRAERTALDTLGSLATRAGQMPLALRLHEEALAVAEREGDPLARSAEHERIAFAAVCLGELDLALDHSTRQLALADEIGDPPERTAALDGIGQALSRMGRLDEAALAFGDARALAETLGRPDLEGRVLNNLGLLLRDQGKLRHARECHERRLQLARQTGRRDSECVALLNLAEVERDSARPQDAQALLLEALDIADGLALGRLAAHARHELGELAHEAGDHATGRRLCGEALATRRDLGLVSAVVDSLERWGLQLAAGGAESEARPLLREACALAPHGAMLARVGLVALGEAEPQAARVGVTAPARDRVRAHAWLARKGAGSEHAQAARALLEMMWADADADEKARRWRSLPEAAWI